MVNINQFSGDNEMKRSAGGYYIRPHDWERIGRDTGLEYPLVISDIQLGDPIHSAHIILSYDFELKKKNLNIRDYMICMPYGKWIPQSINLFAASLDFEAIEQATGLKCPFDTSKRELMNPVACANIIVCLDRSLKEIGLDIRNFQRIMPSNPQNEDAPVVTVMDKNTAMGNYQYDGSQSVPYPPYDGYGNNAYYQQNYLVFGNNFLLGINENYGSTLQSVERINPIEAEKRFKSLVPVFTVGSDLFVYTGTHYQVCEKNSFSRLFVKVYGGEYEAAGSPHFPDQVYECLQNDPEICRESFLMDNNIISFLNGILYLDSMILYRHDSRFNTSYRVMADYYRNPAECPRFEQFLYEVSGGDTDIVKRIYQMIGYTISPKLDKKVLFLLQGVPNSGKTLLSSFVESLFNPEAVFSMDIERYEGKFNVSELMGKALCISPDMSGKPLSRALVSKLKQLTGNDTIGVERKFKSMVTFRNTATILLGTNYPLLTAEQEEGFEERVVTIPFRFSTPKEQRDSSLLDKLKQERSAIVSKAINLYHEMELSGADFAGKFAMNEYVMKLNEKDAYNTDISTLVYQFVKNNYCER